ncbi:unnamed protein product [Diamesa serratosioi]
MKKQTKVQINEQTMGYYGFASSGTASIITLNVSFTDIRIPFVNASFTNLLMFHAAYNGLEKIDDIGSETWPSLKLLNLSHNALTNIKSKLFPYLKELEILDMSSNCFTHFHFEHELYIHENLKKLYLQNNLIHKVEWPKLIPGIRHILDFLDLSNNKLKIFQSYHMTVKTLLLNNNALEKIIYKEDLRFKCHLEAQHNHIREIISTFDFSHLNLSYNEMESFDDLGLLYFSSVDVLDLSHNKLKPITIEEGDDSDDYSTELSYMTGSEEMMKFIVTIKYVNLSYNQIDTINSVSGMERFKKCVEMNLEGNNMANISYDKIRSEFKSLVRVNLKKNPLTKVDLNEIKFHNTTQFLGIHFDYDDPDKKEEIKVVDPLAKLLLSNETLKKKQQLLTALTEPLTTTETPPLTTTITRIPANYNKTLTTSITSTTPLIKAITTTTEKARVSSLSDNKADSYQSIWIWITVIGIVLIAPLTIYFIFLRKRFHHWTFDQTPRTYNEVENFL